MIYFWIWQPKQKQSIYVFMGCKAQQLMELWSVSLFSDGWLFILIFLFCSVCKSRFIECNGKNIFLSGLLWKSKAPLTSPLLPAIKPEWFGFLGDFCMQEWATSLLHSIFAESYLISLLSWSCLMYFIAIHNHILESDSHIFPILKSVHILDSILLKVNSDNV